MEPIASEHVLVDGHRLAVSVLGSGPPVVLVHGTPSTSLIWRNVVPRVVEAGFAVHLFDLLGFGESERPWDETVDTSMSGQVPILAGLLDAWGLDTAHLVGHDIGAAIVQRMGVFHVDRLRSLTLINAVCFDASPSETTKRLMAGGLETMLSASAEDHRERFEPWLRSAVAEPDGSGTADALSAYLAYISGPVGQASYFQHQMRHYEAHHAMGIADRLAELSAVPVQVIWGTDDVWLDVEWGDRLHRAIPGSDLHLVPHAGHFAMEDQPDAIARLVADFVAATERDDTNRPHTTTLEP